MPQKIYEICVPYLDDVIVFSRTFDELIENVRTVLRKLHEHGIKPENESKMFNKEVTYLGRIVPAYWCRMDVKEVLELKETNRKALHDVRKLPGLLRYYRKYIRNFSRIAQPLFELLKLLRE